MKYISKFRNLGASRVLVEKIRELASKIESEDQPVQIMEVCGTHTMAIGKHGIRNVLPPEVELLSGPGCPVCVTDSGYIDAAIKLAEKGITNASNARPFQGAGPRLRSAVHAHRYAAGLTYYI